MPSPHLLFIFSLLFLSLSYTPVRANWLVMESFYNNACQESEVVSVVYMNTCYSIEGENGKVEMIDVNHAAYFSCLDTSCNNCPYNETITLNLCTNDQYDNDEYYSAYISNSFPSNYHGVTQIIYTQPNCTGVVALVAISTESSQPDCSYGPSGTECITTFDINGQLFCDVPSFLSKAVAPPTAPPFLPTAPPTPSPSHSGFNSSAPFIRSSYYSEAGCVGDLEFLTVQQVGSCFVSNTISSYYELKDNVVYSVICYSADCSGQCFSSPAITDQCESVNKRDNRHFAAHSKRDVGSVKISYSPTFPYLEVLGMEVMVEFNGPSAAQCQGGVNFMIMRRDTCPADKYCISSSNLQLFCSVDSMLATLDP